MSYRVLARKYRSRTFDEVVGQNPIATTLKNALLSGRIHHGYLFCGTRGIGKTSMARILAKSLNCLAHDQPTATPCNECESCRTVAEGEDLDVIEIDAASNTGVDHIRELRNNAAFRPARSRFKVYIIDEVHMLSTGAFNALLKTLEEPPDHVKFILATTEVQKVPATIQSRCLRFDFRSLSVDEIAGQLKRILDSEGIASEEAAVRRVARLADGSMRDALSILDQLLSLGREKIDAALLDEIIPAPHDELTLSLVEHIAESDAAGALELVDRCLASGHTPDRFCESLIEQIRRLMLIRVCGPDTNLVDLPVQDRARWVRLSERFDEPTYVYMLALIEELRRNVRYSGAGRALTDAAVVRLTQSARFSAIESLLSGRQGESSTAAAAAQQPARKKKIAEDAGRIEPPPGERTDRKRHLPAATAAGRPSGYAATVPVHSKASPEDRGRALADPLVRRAMELFDGSLVSVEHLPEPASSDGQQTDATA